MSDLIRGNLPALLLAALLLFCTLFAVSAPGRALFAALLPDRGALRGEDVFSRLAQTNDETQAPKKEETTEAGTEPPAAIPEAETEPETAGAYSTPQDILSLSAAYTQAHRGAAAYGTVKETFFGGGSATDTVNGVYIRNCTATKKPDFAALLAEGPPLSVADPAAPVVLIYHTHTTEGYLPADDGVFYRDYVTRTKDPAQSVVRVGDAVCEALAARGIGFVHDKTIYDEAYNGAYARSRAGAAERLSAQPSILITIDVHRDAIYPTDTTAVKPTAEIGGKKAAQIMIITGAEEGLVTDFPEWEQNLRFALALQALAQEKYEGLMKPIYFCQRKYNMDLTPCSLLLEFGSDTNTLEEAVYSGHLLGDALAELILAHAQT